MEPIKSCRKCGSTADFVKSKKAKDGYDNQCKTCMRAASVAWRIKNKERHRKSVQQWYRNNKQKSREYHSTYEQTPKGKYKTYKSHAKDRNHEFALSFDEFNFIISSACEYCGLAPSGGIDRKNNALGYVLDNSAPCCWQCNRAKHAGSETEFRAWIGRLVIHHTKETKWN